MNSAQMRKDQIVNEIHRQIQNAKNLSNTSQNSTESVQNNENSFPPLNESNLNLNPKQANEMNVPNSNQPSSSATPINRNYSSAVSNSNPRQTRIEHLIKMRIIPPFTREHLSSPSTFDTAVQSCYVAILGSFSARFRPMITISKTHTNIGNRKLQTLMVTAPIEAEDEINVLQLNGLQILNRTIFPTADEIWRYSPSMYPKKYTMRIEGLPILCGDDELMEILAMPVGQLASSITRHTATTELGTVYTGTAHGTVQIMSAEEEESLKKWSKQNGISSTPNWHGLVIRAHVPRLHSCENCSNQMQRLIIGHDDAWCRKKRPPVQPIEQQSEENEMRQQNTEIVETRKQVTAPPTQEPEEGEITDDTNWYESSTRTFKSNKKRNQNFENTPNSTPQKNKFQAFSEDLNAPSPAVSPRSRSPEQQPQKQLFNNG